MKKIALLFILSSFSLAFTQHEGIPCGSDETSLQLLKDYPSLLQPWTNAYYQQEDFIHHFEVSRGGDTIYKIPVVVHLIHFDGSENISDDQIKNGVQILTRNFRKQNPDTVDIVPFFQPIAADMKIEFELAKLDPQGNCTNGINRIRSTLTNIGDHQVKSLIHWPRNQYLNIYIVKNAAGLAGHALMPFQAESIPHLDGIVLAGNYMGNTGTSNDLRSVVLSHEAGHYLDLYHVWGGNNVPGFYYLPCADTGNCAYDDGVLDTPNTLGWPSCNLAGNTCDTTLDNVQNFMDYAYCARMFTEGQKNRARAALNSPIAERDQLWSAANMIATGLSGTVTLCQAEFNTPRQTYCVGDSIQFTDASIHGVTSWNWDFGDGNFSNLPNPKHAYASSGSYTVSLTVSDGTSTITATKNNYMFIVNSSGIVLPYTEWFEWIDSLEQSGMKGFVESDGWEIVQGSGATGNQCLKATNENDTLRLKYSLISPEINLTGYASPEFSFDYAFAQQDSTNNDIMYFRISRNCGQTWATLNTQTNSLPTHTGFVSGNYVPSQNDWRHMTISNIPVSYKTDGIIFKIDFISGGGNDFYIDDINIYDLATIGISPTNNHYNIRVFPNPTSQQITIDGEFENAELNITDINGRLLITRNIQSSELINLEALSNGLYLVNIIVGNHKTTEKLIVQH